MWLSPEGVEHQVTAAVELLHALSDLMLVEGHELLLLSQLLHKSGQPLVHDESAELEAEGEGGWWRF